MIGEAVEPRTRTHQVIVLLETDPTFVLTKDPEHLKSLPLFDRKRLQRLRIADVENAPLLPWYLLHVHRHVPERLNCRWQQPACRRLTGTNGHERDAQGEAQLRHVDHRRFRDRSQIQIPPSAANPSMKTNSVAVSITNPPPPLPIMSPSAITRLPNHPITQCWRSLSLRNELCLHELPIERRGVKEPLVR